MGRVAVNTVMVWNGNKIRKKFCFIREKKEINFEKS